MDVRAIPEGTATITPHLVVRDAARAAEWYASAFGAEERDRLVLPPGGKLMYVELWFGDSAVRVSDEFPEAGIRSPQSIGGTPVVLHLFTADVDALWERAVDAGAEILHPSRTSSGGSARSGDRSVRASLGHGPAPRDVPREEIERAAAAAFGG